MGSEDDKHMWKGTGACYTAESARGSHPGRKIVAARRYKMKKRQRAREGINAACVEGHRYSWVVWVGDVFGWCRERDSWRRIGGHCEPLFVTPVGRGARAFRIHGRGRDREGGDSHGAGCVRT